jgi:tetratricopeptide (TPR) repeat protein/Zn-finger nucleic acid-binding protein
MSFRSAAPECPACGAILEEESLFEMRTLHCEDCGGAWFDALGKGDSLGAVHSHACPRCEHELREATVARAPALSCAHCGGGFLPRASFKALLAEPRALGTMPPPRPAHAQLLAVVRALSKRLGMVALLLATGVGCAGGLGAGAGGRSIPSLAELRSDGDSSDVDAVGRAVLGEMILPGGDAARATRGNDRLTALKAETLVGSLAQAIYAETHGRPSRATNAYVRALMAARTSEESDAALYAWFAAHRLAQLRGSVAGLYERHRAAIDDIVKQPGNLGWRATAELLDFALAAAYDKAEIEGPAGAERVAARVGCGRNIRIAGPFGHGVAADRRRSFDAEKPGPWPPFFAEDRIRASRPRILRTEQPRCFASAADDTETGIFYAETFVTAEKPLDVIVAVQGALAVFIDDAPVLERDLREWGVWQRFGVRVQIPAGRHRVVARLLNDGTTIRFLNPDGTPAAVKSDGAATLPYSVVPPQIIGDPNPIAEIVKKRSEPSPIRAFFAAYVAHVEGMDDVASALIDPAVTPDDAAAVALEFAAIYARGDNAFPDEARRRNERALRTRAIARDNRLWYSRAWLAIDTGEQKGGVDAVEPLRKLATEVPEVPDVLEGLARLYARLGWRGERLHTLRELGARFPDDVSGLQMLLAALDEEGPPKEADALAARIRKLDPDAEVEVDRALARRDYKAAIAELRRIQKRRPDRKELAARIAGVLEQAGDPAAAAKQLETALERDRDNAKARFRLADRALSKGDESSLRRALAEALQSGASTSELRDAIALVEGATNLEGYRIDGRAAIKEFERWERGGKHMEGTAARVLDYAALWVHPDGTSEMLEHEIQRIQSQEAVSKESEQPPPQGLVLRLRVIKKDGSILEPEIVAGKPTVTMPHLEVGDIIESERILQTNSDGDARRYRSPHWFFREADKGYWRSEFITITPKGKALEIETRGKVPAPKVRDLGAFVEHRWRVDESPPAVEEPDAPHAVEFLPSVRLGWGVSLEDTLTRLVDIASDETPLDPRLGTIAQSIVKGVPEADRLERARRVYRWVLSAVEDGNENDGRRAVLGRRGSKQAAFVHLVRQLGIPAELAIAKNRLAMPPLGKMSEVENWDSLLLRLTATKQSPTWLAIRDKFTPFGYVPAELRGQPAIVLTSGTPKVVLPTEGSLDGVAFEGRAVVREDGGAALEVVQRYGGRIGTQMRSVLDRIPPGQLRDFVETRLMGRNFSGARVRDVKIEDKDDLDKPVAVRVTADAPELVRPSGSGSTLKSVFPLKLGQIATLPERQTPLLLGSASHAQVLFRVVFPESWHMPADLPPGDARDGERIVQVRDRVEGHTITLDRRVDVPAGRVQPGAEYAAFLKFARDGDTLLERDIAIGR